MSRDPRFERFVEAIENLILEENRHSDPPSAHYIPHDLARWFVEAAKLSEWRCREPRQSARPAPAARPPC